MGRCEAGENNMTSQSVAMQAKSKFSMLLGDFASSLKEHITINDKWTIKGFIDIYKNIYPISTDTKVISKLLELHLFPHFLTFAESNGYEIELSSHQNYYPDLTFITKADNTIKFAVDIKTTYQLIDYPGFCNGFTLGSHGEYFINRNSAKNIQYSYNQYSGHYCFGIIYTRTKLPENIDLRLYSIDELESIPSVISDFVFFAAEKWQIASDKRGSGNTANIGSIQRIEDILKGEGVFSKAGEEIFDDYWINYGKLQVAAKNGGYKSLSSIDEYITYRNLSPDLIVARPGKRKALKHE